jgi:hypothetical protein
MSKTIAALCLGLTLATAAAPAFAAQHQRPAPRSHINSGWGPPTTWDEIEVSHPEGGG